MIKILNLYAGIGGNRKLWNDNIEVTSVEINKDIANIYKDYFPNDNLIISDAHEFLLNNYMNYDFIWSSPPCQSHSSFRQNIGVRFRNVKAIYPDMKLWQEILFLKHNFKGKFVVENVIPYYDFLIKGYIKLERHLFWTNFDIPIKTFKKDIIRKAQIKDLELMYNYDLSNYKIENKRQILRNCVNPEIGSYIFDTYKQGLS